MGEESWFFGTPRSKSSVSSALEETASIGRRGLRVFLEILVFDDFFLDRRAICFSNVSMFSRVSLAWTDWCSACGSGVVHVFATGTGLSCCTEKSRSVGSLLGVANSSGKSLSFGGVFSNHRSHISRSVVAI